MIVNIYKSIKIWDHYPTKPEIYRALSPHDPIFRTVNDKKLEAFLSIYGTRVWYNGSSVKPKFKSEVLYYYKDGERVVCELNDDTNLSLM